MIRPTVRIAKDEKVRLTGAVTLYRHYRYLLGDLIIDPRRRHRLWVATQYGYTPAAEPMRRRLLKLTISAARRWISDPYRWARWNVIWRGKLVA